MRNTLAHLCSTTRQQTSLLVHVLPRVIESTREFTAQTDEERNRTARVVVAMLDFITRAEQVMSERMGISITPLAEETRNAVRLVEQHHRARTEADAVKKEALGQVEGAENVLGRTMRGDVNTYGDVNTDGDGRRVAG